MSRPPDVEVRMTLDDAAQVPRYAVPAGFKIVWYESGDEAAWIDIHLQADKYKKFDVSTFASQFGTDMALLHERQCYLVSPSGEKIGTSTAWFDHSYRDGRYGRIHWVAIVPSFQGQGLARPLLSAACQRLVTLGHRKAYLGSVDI